MLQLRSTAAASRARTDPRNTHPAGPDASYVRIFPESNGRLRARGAHRLAGLHLADRARDRTDDSRLAATLDFVFVGRRLEHASDARGLSGNHRHRLPGHPDYAAINERRPRRDTGIVDQKFRGRTVSRVDYEVMCARRDAPRWTRRARRACRLNLDVGESLAEPSRRRLHLWRADIASRERSPGARDSTARPGRDRRASAAARPHARATTMRGRQVLRRRRSVFDPLPLSSRISHSSRVQRGQC